MPMTPMTDESSVILTSISLVRIRIRITLLTLKEKFTCLLSHKISQVFI